jgi:mannose-6-phosphate isomerase
MMNEPVELTPQPVSALWGGTRLGPGDVTVAEVWLASDLPHRPTPIAHGPQEGRPPAAALGRPLPALAKFLDARLPLSVQVHPDDALARARGFDCGKSEAWVVLHADAGARIYAGLKSGVTGRDLAAATAEGRVADLIASFEPKAGDIVSLPAGTVHALGAGVTVFEVQQSSDVTYRLFDWGRVDPQTGRPRALHIADALACVTKFGPVEPRRGSTSLATPFFDLHVHRTAATFGGDGRARLLVAYGGDATGCVHVPSGRAVLIPRSDGECRATPAAGGWLFECVIP